MYNTGTKVTFSVTENDTDRSCFLHLVYTFHCKGNLPLSCRFYNYSRIGHHAFPSCTAGYSIISCMVPSLVLGYEQIRDFPSALLSFTTEQVYCTVLSYRHMDFPSVVLSYRTEQVQHDNTYPSIFLYQCYFQHPLFHCSYSSHIFFTVQSHSIRDISMAILVAVHTRF